MFAHFAKATLCDVHAEVLLLGGVALHAQHLTVKYTVQATQVLHAILGYHFKVVAGMYPSHHDGVLVCL
jgi:hypothetical protein